MKQNDQVIGNGAYTKSEQIADFYPIISNLLDGEDFDSFLVDDVNESKTIHIFKEGQEQAHIITGFSSPFTTVKNPPEPMVEELKFQNLFARQGAPLETRAGELFAIGGASLTFELITDPSGNFILGNVNEIVTDSLNIPPGDYPIVARVTGSFGEIVDRNFIIKIIGPLPLSAVMLSTNNVVEGLANDRFIADITAVGGISPYSFVLTDDPSGLFKITGNQFESNGVIGVSGTQYPIKITVTDGLLNEFEQNLTVIAVDALVNAFSVSLDGTTQLIQMLRSSPLNIDTNNEFALSFWFLRPNTAGSDTVFCNYSSSSNNNQGMIYFFDSNANNRLNIHLNFSGAQQIRIRPEFGAPTVNVWTHVAISYDGSGVAAGLTVWLNGVIVANNSLEDNLAGASIKNSDPNLYLGARGNNTQNYIGNLEQASFFAAELTQAEVDSLYNAGNVQDLRLKLLFVKIEQGYEFEQDGKSVKGQETAIFINESPSTFSVDVP